MEDIQGVFGKKLTEAKTMSGGSMKKALKIGLGIIVVSLMSTVAMAGIAGSAHDFSGETWSTNDICGPCHTPHNALSGSAPLWNHSNTTTTAWSMYDNTNGTQNASVPGEPSAVSKACLSCHDGTVAVDAMVGRVGTVNISTYAGKTIGGGGDLSDSHPISIDYDNALYVADGGLFNPTNTPVAALLIGSKVECASCHDVHNASDYDNLLNVDNIDSALCLTCHDK